VRSEREYKPSDYGPKHHLKFIYIGKYFKNQYKKQDFKLLKHCEMKNIGQHFQYKHYKPFLFALFNLNLSWHENAARPPSNRDSSP